MKKHNQTKSLLDVAERYIHWGYSVIPVRNDKSPIFSWKSKQSHRDDFNSLYYAINKRSDVAGIGIVTGSISQLAVLDFDDLTLYDQFKEQHPHLTKTYTVRTRRGYHLYFAVKDTIHTQTRKCKGVDWLFNGCYVVAPPSIIAGFQYHIEQANIAHPISAKDLDNIHQFLEAQQIPQTTYEPVEDLPNLLPEDARRLYKQYAKQGRNNALFRVALMARDHGWSQATAEHILLEPFVHDNQLEESNRRQEGQKTIASAYSRPPRTRLVENEPDGLPNTVREVLLKQNLTCAIRTLEGLRQKGIQPGQTFTELQARYLLTDIVGFHSIRKTLKASVCKNDTTHVAKEMPIDNISKCLEISQSKSKLNQRGRRTHVYIMPSNIELAEQLGVTLTRISDSLTAEDLSSAKNTRQAMHREFILRRPGVYPSRWLAKRLSISVVTKNRYDSEIPVHKTPTYRIYPITLESCGMIPEEAENGIFLEDDKGRCYPPKIEIAKYLLKWGRVVVMKIQSNNFYCIGNPLPKATHPPSKIQPALPTITQLNYTARLVDVYPQKHTKPPFLADLTTKRESSTHPTEKHLFRADSGKVSTLQKTYQKTYRVQLPLPHEEDCANRLYRSISDMGQTTFSLSSARRLVDRYGIAAVHYGLNRIRSKARVTNPAGFLTVIVRTYQYLS